MASYKSTLRFCPTCNNSNWMMGKNEKMELVFKCKVCNRVEVVDMDEDPDAHEQKKLEDLCCFRHDVLFVAKESIIAQPDVIHDPTLTRIYDYECHICLNEEERLKNIGGAHFKATRNLAEIRTRLRGVTPSKAEEEALDARVKEERKSERSLRIELDRLRGLGGLGVHRIIVEACSLLRAPGSNEAVGQLKAGDLVEILEANATPDHQVWARLKEPVGWIPLINMETSRRTAFKVLGTSMDSACDVPYLTGLGYVRSMATKFNHVAVWTKYPKHDLTNGDLMEEMDASDVHAVVERVEQMGYAGYRVANGRAYLRSFARPTDDYKLTKKDLSMVGDTDEGHFCIYEPRESSIKDATAVALFFQASRASQAEQDALAPYERKVRQAGLEAEDFLLKQGAPPGTDVVREAKRTAHVEALGEIATAFGVWQQAVFYRLSETIVSDAMAILLMCCRCSNWRTEGKDVQYSDPEERIK